MTKTELNELFEKWVKSKSRAYSNKKWVVGQRAVNSDGYRSGARSTFELLSEVMNAADSYVAERIIDSGVPDNRIYSALANLKTKLEEGT